jgi:hypothetical protein
VLHFLFFFTCFFFVSVHFTIAGPVDDDEHMPPQSPHMSGIVQDLVCEVEVHGGP